MERSRLSLIFILLAWGASTRAKAASTAPSAVVKTAAPGNAPAQAAAGPAASPGAQAPRLALSLAAAVERALAASPTLEAARLEASAANAAAHAQRSLLAPEVRLEAAGRYQSEVSELAIPLPNTAPRKLGDNLNYSVGPSLQWSVWDKGADRKSWESLSALARAKGADYDALGRQTVLAGRTAYFQVQLGLEQVRLLADTLRLAAAQHRDITIGLEAGMKSRIDLLMAHQEVLARRRQLRQARADLACALRDLLRLTGAGEGLDLSLPFGAGAQGPPDGAEPATVLVETDPIERSAAGLEAAAAAGPDPAHPGIESWARVSESFALASGSLNSQRWPRLTLTARTSLEYPNGMALKDFFQNTVGLAASIPLFEWGRSARKAEEAAGRAESASRRREAAGKDLRRDWDKASDQLAGLKAQQELNRADAAEASELAGLVYESYKAGRSTFLEVQSSNVRSLEAKVNAARTDVQVLIQLAALASMARP